MIRRRDRTYENILKIFQRFSHIDIICPVHLVSYIQRAGSPQTPFLNSQLSTHFDFPRRFSSRFYVWKRHAKVSPWGVPSLDCMRKPRSNETCEMVVRHLKTGKRHGSLLSNFLSNKKSPMKDPLSFIGLFAYSMPKGSFPLPGSLKIPDPHKKSKKSGACFSQLSRNASYNFSMISTSLSFTIHSPHYRTDIML